MRVTVCALLLAAGAQAIPAPEASPQLLVPSLYHAPANCTNQEDVITTKSCVPVSNQECEDVEIPTQRIEVVKTCKDITVQNCGLEPVEAEAESAVEAEGDRKRREADPQLLVPGVLPYAAPVVPLLKHVCKEETQEYCYPETKVVEDTITTKKCLWKTSVECQDVEHKIPKVVCDAIAPLPAPIPVF